MQRYIDQLVGDIEAAILKIPPFLESDPWGDEDDNYLDNLEHILLDDGIQVSRFCRIGQEYLPPANRLNENQLDQLLDSLLKMFWAYSIRLVYPENAPSQLIYEAIRQEWNLFRIPNYRISVYFDLCPHLPDNCIFKGYCEECTEEELTIDEVLSQDEQTELFTYKPLEEDGDGLGLKGSKKFIDGIFSYCDRWCERCTLSSHCSNFAALSQAQTSGEMDIANRVFWANLKAVYQPAREKVLQIIETNPHLKNTCSDNNKTTPSFTCNDLVSCANQYMQLAADWLAKVQKQPEWGSNSLLSDSASVISWYHSFVYMKLKHAACDWNKSGTLSLIKSNGSAKVSLAGIERSLHAWGALTMLNAVDEKTLVGAWTSLENLKHLIFQLFPRATTFERPGFDDPSMQMLRSDDEDLPF